MTRERLAELLERRAPGAWELYEKSAVSHETSSAGAERTAAHCPRRCCALCGIAGDGRTRLHQRLIGSELYFAARNGSDVVQPPYGWLAMDPTISDYALGRRQSTADREAPIWHLNIVR